jgi:hypothetical protein
VKVGLHDDLTYYGTTSTHAAGIDVAKSVGAQVSRNSFMWDSIEPREGVYDWSITDNVVDGLGAAGIEPLFVVYGSPSWANGVSSGTPDARFHVPPEGPAFDAWLARYRGFITNAVQRYRGRVDKWEIWNEENLHYMWKPMPSPRLYARLYTGLRDAILAADPDADVAIGGLGSYCCVGPGDISGIQFLQRVVAEGAPIDNLAVHAYAGRQQAPDVHLEYENNFDDIEAWHRYLVGIGRGAVPIWVTEWGWESRIGLNVQADYVTRSLEMIATLYPYVTIATYFTGFDKSGYTQGLYDRSMRPKPAAEAFSAFTRERGAPSGIPSSPRPRTGAPPSLPF